MCTKPNPERMSYPEVLLLIGSVISSLFTEL